MNLFAPHPVTSMSMSSVRRSPPRCPCARAPPHRRAALAPRYRRPTLAPGYRGRTTARPSRHEPRPHRRPTPRSSRDSGRPPTRAYTPCLRGSPTWCSGAGNCHLPARQASSPALTRHRREQQHVQNRMLHRSSHANVGPVWLHKVYRCKVYR